jgi:hypothetical protein
MVTDVRGCVAKGETTLTSTSVVGSLEGAALVNSRLSPVAESNCLYALGDG